MLEDILPNIIRFLDFPTLINFLQSSSRFYDTTDRSILESVHNVVENQAKVDLNGGTIKVAANFETKISDYKIPVPSFSGITVADKVQVEVTFSAPVEIKK